MSGQPFAAGDRIDWREPAGPWDIDSLAKYRADCGEGPYDVARVYDCADAFEWDPSTLQFVPVYQSERRSYYVEIRPNVAEYKGERPPSFGVRWFVKVGA